MLSRLNEILKANFPAIFSILFTICSIGIAFGLIFALFDYILIALLFILVTGLSAVLFFVSIVFFILDENRKERELKDRLLKDRKFSKES